ncbi:fungal-specific transcription factor domain-containing protein [Microdochium trichocladiopsis]|uniref:Fungal-specific transcription factor domain-containing protein n=1 Tax=Microdochium trichocladiopsis TaxID=1682393 RepID=A0A9P8XWW5_9PEZI|nr:fungal-specific transcription factor domain-containing protein [Microdochium trichocladiopsis]KAH7017982.1 fungal-specific transcription factor domain-containing protein [Microdochium trichocladiopsis]
MPRPAGQGQQSSSATARPSRRRANAPKTRSRNGCSTCKARRLKCDETKPACLACVKSNRPCPGYRKAFRWSTKHEASLGDPDDSALELPYAEVSTALNVLSSPSRQSAPRRKTSDAAHDIITFSTPSGGLTEHESDTRASRRTSTGDIDESTPNFDDFVIDELEQALEEQALEAAAEQVWDMQDDVGMPLLQPAGSETVSSAADMMVVPFSDVALLTGGDRIQMSTTVPRGLHDYSSLLVGEWFKHVCPMFSSFDSDVNLMRKFAQESWTRSVAINSSLQSMAAICLAPQMPFMRRVAASHLNNAICAIETDLQLVRNTETPQLHTDLLLALCCVGTTACWVNTSDTVTHYLKEAQTLFRRALRGSEDRSPAEAQRLQFFSDSLVYWNMLVSVVSEDSEDGEPDAATARVLLSTQDREQARIIPHPWTGTSAAAQALLGRAIRLCRLFRLRFKRNMKMTALNLEAALGEIRQAQQIEEELLALEHPSIDKIVETGDKLSPRSHFYYVAEAYRLASLLQLYQTFPDLVTRRLPEQATDSSGCVPWDKWIVPLCLRLVEVLRQIPVSSGTRCIQPLLYITASTGLRFDQAVLAQSRAPAQNTPVADMFPLANESAGLEAMQSLFGIDSTMPFAASTGVTALSLEVTHARQFVLGRLGMLEHSLPPAPIRVAQDLVKAIWAAYDADLDPGKYTHWIDIMEKSNLRTIFG